MLGLAWARTVANRECRRQQAVLRIIAERSRLATELHDTLEQGLAGIQLQLGAVSRSLDSSPPTARRALSCRARRCCGPVIAEARRSVMDLRHGALETRDLAGALTSVSRTDDQRHAAARQGSEPPARVAPSLKPSDEHHLLRIGLEALTNTIKHSQATRVDVELRLRGDSLVGGSWSRTTAAGSPVTDIDDEPAAISVCRGIRERVDTTWRHAPTLGNSSRLAALVVAVTVPRRRQDRSKDAGRILSTPMTEQGKLRLMLVDDRYSRAPRPLQCDRVGART